MCEQNIAASVLSLCLLTLLWDSLVIDFWGTVYKPPFEWHISCSSWVIFFRPTLWYMGGRCHICFYVMVCIDLRISGNFIIDLSVVSNSFLWLQGCQLPNLSFMMTKAFNWKGFRECLSVLKWGMTSSIRNDPVFFLCTSLFSSHVCTPKCQILC